MGASAGGPREIAVGAGGRGRRRRPPVVFRAVPAHDDGHVDGVVLYGEDVTGWPEHS